MTGLNTVSETALITLKARAVETGNKLPLIQDPMSIGLISSLRDLNLTGQQQRVLDQRLPRTLLVYIALRARKYDSYARAFLKENPSGLVLNLGAGFDTRYWRISAEPGNYMEVDLPEVVDMKKKILGNSREYDLIACSVLEKEWMEQVARKQKERILFLAEGLLMYLPENEVIRFFGDLASRFSASQIVFEAVNRKYTRGFWKKMVVSKMKRRIGTRAGSEYQYGIANGRDVETYAPNIKFIEEWSYFEETDLRPGALRLLRHFKTFARTQWTINARIS